MRIATVTLKNLLKKYSLKKSSFSQTHNLLKKIELKMQNLQKKKKHW